MAVLSRRTGSRLAPLGAWALSTLALASCGEGEPTATVAEGCGDSSSSVPVAAAQLDADGVTVRMAYGGSAEPCQFGATLYNGSLYIELRSDPEGQAPEGLSSPLSCAEGRVQKPLPVGTRVFPVGPGEPDAAVEREAKSLLDLGSDCPEVARGQPAFIID